MAGSTNDVTNTLIANITSTEQSTSAVDINRSNGSPSYASTAAQFTTYLNVPVGGTAPLFPVNTVTQFYIKNLDPTGSITVSWTPVGGGGVLLVQTLAPGAMIYLWANPASSATSGITNLSLNTGQVGGCLCEYFLGG